MSNSNKHIRPLVVKSAAISEVKAYHLVFDQFGWATFYVDDLHGTLSIVSDYGNWSHRWGRGAHLGASGLLSDFLVRNGECYYLADKLMRREERNEYSEELTKDRMLEAVIESRRAGDLDREEARQRWNAVLNINFEHGGDSVQHEIHCDPDLGYFRDESWEWIKEEPTVAYLILRDQLLPLFLEEIRRIRPISVPDVQDPLTTGAPA